MITIKVEVLDRDGRVIFTDLASGNTVPTVKTAAGALARTLEHQYSDHKLAPVTTRIGRAVKTPDKKHTPSPRDPGGEREDAIRPDGPETDRGGLIGQQPY